MPVGIRIAYAHAMMSTSSSHESVRVAALGQATLSTRRRIAAAAGLGLLAVLSLWPLIAARLEWLVAPIPLLFLAIALGLLLRREWALLAARIVSWPIFVVALGVCAYHLLTDPRPWEDGTLIAMIYPLPITSGWASSGWAILTHCCTFVSNTCSYSPP